jgi:sulfite exporter TauE/SafE
MTFTMLFFMGLAGSLHCAGMCGGLVVLAVGPGAPRRILATLLYLTGKGSIYVFLGTLSGALGHTIVTIVPLSLGSRVVALAGGLVLLIVGFQSLGLIPGSDLSLGWLGRVSRFAIRLTNEGGLSGKLLLGGATALLPCPMIYGFLAMAAATGSPVWGAAIMLILAVTSAIPLGVCALAGDRVSRLIPFRASLLAGILMIAMAALTLYRGLIAGTAASHMAH